MDTNSTNKQKKIVFNRNTVLVLGMSVLFFTLSFICWWKEEDVFSESERRMLAKFPKMSMETVMNGSFMKDFESYSLDQFPFRDGFRSIKAVASYGIFGKKDNNGIYLAEGHLSKMEYPMQTKMLDNAAMRIEEIYNMYLKEQESKCYFSVVLDKNYFLAEKNGYLSMDYGTLVSYMREKVDFAEYIDITHLLSLEDYYRTDTHWRQEKIVDVAECLKTAMKEDDEVLYNNKAAVDEKWKTQEIGKESAEFSMNNYEIKELEIPFYGVYYGQAALPVKPDKLYYLESDILRQCKVRSFDTGKAMETVIYNMEKANDSDAYEIFLSGTSALQVIENPNAKEDKELIVFRDSFGSSLVPLLVDGYSKIIVIDTRYVQSKMLGNLVDFHGQDVLFLYSTVILNNSMSLR